MVISSVTVKIKKNTIPAINIMTTDTTERNNIRHGTAAEDVNGERSVTPVRDATPVMGGTGGPPKNLINPLYTMGDVPVTVSKYNTESKNTNHT